MCIFGLMLTSDSPILSGFVVFGESGLAAVARLPHWMLFNPITAPLKSLPRFAYTPSKLLNSHGLSGSPRSGVSNSSMHSLRSPFEKFKLHRTVVWCLKFNSTIAAWMAFNFGTFCPECSETSCWNASSCTQSTIDFAIECYFSLGFQ